ncbi:MAG: prepilin-type N-terminal cleavage/methylation domain-containing protein [Phycisphaerales bacterium]
MNRNYAKAVTLIELLIVVMIISVFTFVAVPRLSMSAVFKGKAQTSAAQIASAIRLCRTLAINNAATNQTGYSLNMTGSGNYTGFQIINLQSGQLIKTENIPSGISCTGASSFGFNALGVRTGSAGNLSISASGKTFIISVITNTGMVKCVQQ